MDDNDRHGSNEIEVSRVSKAVGVRLGVDPQTIEPEVRAEFAKRSNHGLREFRSLFVERALRRNHARERRE
jgi:hypothetical protein